MASRLDEGYIVLRLLCWSREDPMQFHYAPLGALGCKSLCLCRFPDAIHAEAKPKAFDPALAARGLMAFDATDRLSHLLLPCRPSGLCPSG